MTIRAFLLLTLFLISSCGSNSIEIVYGVSASSTKYTLIRIPHNKEVAVKVAWATDWAYQGNLNQSVPRAGSELVLTSGSDEYQAGEATEIMADLQAQASIEASPDFVFGSFEFPLTSMMKIVPVVNSHLRSPSFEDEWLRRIVETLRNDWRDYSLGTRPRLFATEGWAVLGSQSLRTFFALDHNIPFLGVTRESVQTWHKSVFTRSPIALVVVGDLSIEDAGLLVDGLLNGLPVRSSELSREVSLNFKPRRILLHAPEASTSQILFVRPMPAGHMKMTVEDRIILSALSEGEDSVLFDAVRRKMGASYDFEAGIESYANGVDVFFIIGTVETNRMAEVELAVKTAYSNFRRSGPTSDMQVLKIQIHDSLEKRMSIPSVISDDVMVLLLNEQPAAEILGQTRKLESVTHKGVKARLRDAYPMPDEFLILGISPSIAALPGACVVKHEAEVVSCE